MGSTATTASMVHGLQSRHSSEVKKPTSSGQANSEQWTAHHQPALLEARKRYVGNNPVSYDLHQKALVCLPGGNSRTVLYSAPFPLSMISGQDYTLTDEDGHKYEIFCLAQYNDLH